MMELTLCDLQPGEILCVSSVDLYGGTRRRLLDLGLIPGERVYCLLKAPSRSPVAFQFKDTVIALRESDCRRIRGSRC